VATLGPFSRAVGFGGPCGLPMVGGLQWGHAAADTGGSALAVV